MKRKLDPSENMPKPISSALYRKLPLQVRVAFGAHFAEQVLRLYSEYFLNKYLGNQCLQLIQEYLQGKTAWRRDAKRLSDGAIKLMPAAEDEGYSRWEVALPIGVIGEMQVANGRNLSLAIDTCAICYGRRVLYSLDVSPADTKIVVQTELFAALGELVDEVAGRAFQAIKNASTASECAEILAGFPLPDPGNRNNVPKEILDCALRKGKKLPPVHERARQRPEQRQVVASERRAVVDTWFTVPCLAAFEFLERVHGFACRHFTAGFTFAVEYRKEGVMIGVSCNAGFPPSVSVGARKGLFTITQLAPEEFQSWYHARRLGNQQSSRSAAYRRDVREALDVLAQTLRDNPQIMRGDTRRLRKA